VSAAAQRREPGALSGLKGRTVGSVLGDSGDFLTYSSLSAPHARRARRGDTNTITGLYISPVAVEMDTYSISKITFILLLILEIIGFGSIDTSSIK